MIKKKLRVILISIFQIVGLAIIYNICNRFYPIQHKSLGFGLIILSTGYIFVFSILILNFSLEFFQKNIYCIAFFLLIITIIFPLSAFNERPLRSLLLILLAFCGFLSSMILFKWKVRIR